ncbi:hypothetical protein ANO14919_064830 [Xylariales sp. No.14919]|nr:hypothetical protein ANO14919_064830 [Xylariales sp. No.14919]
MNGGIERDKNTRTESKEKENTKKKTDAQRLDVGSSGAMKNRRGEYEMKKRKKKKGWHFMTRRAVSSSSNDVCEAPAP